MTLQSALLNEVKAIQHGFGTQSEPLPQFALEKWDDRPSWKQVHGTGIARVNQARQECGDVDALVTDSPLIPIAVVTADCVPLLFAHRSGRSIAAVHAGWRGTLARITEKLWSHLTERGENPKEWLAAIGPCIGPCCYEVSQELIETFQSSFPGVPSYLWNPQGRMLDLAALNRETLLQIGIGEVDLVRSCTRCSTSPKFYSYRRGDRESRQYSAIRICGSL
jgi:hypothetical protein